MSGHTPGPWVVNDNPEGLPIVSKAHSFEAVAHIRMPSWADGQEVDANARLIALAPDLLLEARNAIAAIASNDSQREFALRLVRDRLELLVARARGT